MTDLVISQLPDGETTLLFIAGDALRFTITIKDPDPDSPDPDNPVLIVRDLTGWTVASQIRRTNRPDSELIASFEFNVLGSDGKINAYLTPDESEKLRGLASGRWDLQLSDPSGDPQTIIYGPVEPEGDTTR